MSSSRKTQHMDDNRAPARGQRTSTNGDSKVRFTGSHVCPVCGGSDRDRRGQGTRCFGYRIDKFVFCTRPEHAGNAPYCENASAYRHDASGPCPCGTEHATEVPRQPRRPNRGTFVCNYQYRDRDGKVLHETVRTRDPKGFFQRRPDAKAKGGYLNNLSGVQLVLYHLPEICNAGTEHAIYIVEGEKDADALSKLGLLATTNPQGAGKWRLVDSSPLHGHACVIIPDNDQQGREHAEDVAKNLNGRASSLKIVELPGLPEKGDVSDWLAIPGNDSDALIRLVANAPYWRGAPIVEARSNGNGSPREIDYASLSAAELGVIDLSAIKDKPTTWLWRYRLVAGEMALLAGEGGLGKSQVMLWVASAVSRGIPWPDGAGDAPQGQVIIVTAEDSAEMTIRPRLRALGADLARIKLVPVPKVMIGQTGKDPYFKLQSVSSLGYWQRLFDVVPDTRLLIMDPVVSCLGKDVNDQKNDEVREALEPFLEQIIRPRGVCFFANTHLSKRLEGRNVVHRITGSIAYVNIPRNVHCVVKDEYDKELRIFGQCKSNNAPDGLKSLQFRISKHMLSSDLGDVETSMAVFSPDLVEADLNRTDGHRGGKGPRPSTSIENAKWLFNELKGHPVRLKALIDEALANGILHQPAEKDKRPSPSPLYNARDRIPSAFPGHEVQEFESEGRKYWQLARTVQDGPPADETPL
jgi:AAA domain